MYKLPLDSLKKTKNKANLSPHHDHLLLLVVLCVRVSFYSVYTSIARRLSSYHSFHSFMGARNAAIGEHYVAIGMPNLEGNITCTNID